MLEYDSDITVVAYLRKTVSLPIFKLYVNLCNLHVNVLKILK